MVERVKLEPTMEEIVVALRETRRSATGTPPYALIGRPLADNWASGAAGRGDKSGDRVRAADAQNGAGPIDINDLRDDEIERLLADNARLNERVVYLLKVIERDQASSLEFAAAQAALETERGAFFRDAKAAFGAELRPVLLVLLRLLEKQRAAPPEVATRRTGPDATGLPTPAAPPADCIPEAARELGGEGEARPKTTGAATSLMPQQPKLRQRMACVLDASALLISFDQATNLQASAGRRQRPAGWQA